MADIELNRKRKWPQVLKASAFFAPNVLIFTVFTLGPVLFTFCLAFFKWDPFTKSEFVGLANFNEILTNPGFWYYLLNTAVFMIGLPLSMAGSLFLAVMLSQRLRGVIGYRTVYYLPSITNGVALFLLWKVMYNREFGLINSLLLPVVNFFRLLSGSDPLTMRQMPDWLQDSWKYPSIPVMLVVFLLLFALWRSLMKKVDRRVGLGIGALALVLWMVAWFHVWWLGLVMAAASAILVGLWWWLRGQLSQRAWLLSGLGFLALVAAVVFWFGAPGASYKVLAGDNEFYTAKPALVFMNVWTFMGGANMILYLAALAGVPTELYEAAEIDGANRWQQFKDITWPMIAPTTFFIFVMGVIRGLQGGFEMAYMMTEGGPEESTTTVGYHIFTSAFFDYRFGYAAAISLILFLLVMGVTLLNWRFGSKAKGY